MKLEISKELVLKVGDGAWRLTKHIVKQGIKATVVETAGSATLAVLDGDIGKAKEQFKFDAIVGPKKVKIKSDKPKKKLFTKKKDKTEELIEAVTEQDVEEALKKAKKTLED